MRITVRRITFVLLTLCVVGCGQFAQHYYRKGLQLASIGRLEKAKVALSRATEHRIYGYPAQEAIVHIDRALAGRIRIEGLIHYYKGVYLSNKNFKNASEWQHGLGEGVAELIEAMKINPHDAAPHAALGTIYAKFSKWDEAVVEWEKAIEIDSRNWEARSQLCHYFAKQRQTDDALLECRKAAAINPDDAGAFYNLGRTYYALDMLEESIVAYEAVLKLTPGDALIHRDLALACFENEAFDLAIYHCDRALRLGANIDRGFLEALIPYRDKPPEALRESRRYKEIIPEGMKQAINPPPKR
ncbi:tetratricopeptide repeat protein [Candidatus Omnitrophota bacterium]